VIYGLPGQMHSPTAHPAAHPLTETARPWQVAQFLEAWEATVWNRHPGGPTYQLAHALTECAETGTLTVRLDTPDGRAHVTRRAGFRHGNAVLVQAARLVDEGFLWAVADRVYGFALPAPERRTR
jgi:hypothetical protein